MDRLHRLASSPMKKRFESLDRQYVMGRDKIRSSLPAAISSSAVAKKEKQESDKLHRFPTVGVPVPAASTTRRKANDSSTGVKDSTTRLHEKGKERHH